MTNTEHNMKNISTLLVVFMIGPSVTPDFIDGNTAIFSSNSLLLIMSLKNIFQREDTMNVFELPYK